MTNRDTLLDIFSDARVAAPVLKAASLHAEAKEANQAYLYVFKHVTKKGYYSEVSSTDINLKCPFGVFKSPKKTTKFLSEFLP